MDLAKRHSFDTDDFELLLSSHQGRLFGFIRALMGPGVDAEDVLQNTNRILWKEAEKLLIGNCFFKANPRAASDLNFGLEKAISFQ